MDGRVDIWLPTVMAGWIDGREMDMWWVSEHLYFYLTT